MFEIEAETSAKVVEDVIEGVKSSERRVVVLLAEIGLLFCLPGCVEEPTSLRVHQQLKLGEKI